MKAVPVLLPLHQQLTRRELGLTSLAAWSSYMTESHHFTARLAKFKTLRLHNGCVNTISWSEDGRLLLSGSDDQHLVISDPFDESNPVKHRIPSGHEGNIFSARFLPDANSSLIVSCASDGTVILTDVNRPDTYGAQIFRCHNGSTYEVAVIPGDSNTFLSCGDDGCVRWYDRREKTACTLCREDVIVECKCSTCAIDVDTTRPWSLAVGCSDSLVRLYDMRRLNKPSSDPTGILGLTSLCCLPLGSDVPTRPKRTTSVDFSRDGTEILVSFSMDNIYAFRTREFAEQKTDINLVQEGGDQMPKKVRLRGDWSDTGPSARPEHDPDEGAQLEFVADADPADAELPPRGDSRLVRRFRSFLSSWMDSHLASQAPPGVRGDQPSTSTDDEENAVVDRLEDVSLEEAAASTSGESAPSSSHGKVRPDQRAKTVAENRKRFYQRLLQMIPQNKCVGSFKGHRNARTMLKQACFWGRNHVMSGSDCGHIFVWRRDTNDIVLTLPGDQRVVNCLQMHPLWPILASSGIDYDVKLWMPIAPASGTDSNKLNELLRRNERMLAETRDTVTIPASFLLRMIAGMNQQWRAQDAGQRDDNDDGNSDETPSNDQSPDT